MQFPGIGDHPILVDFSAERPILPSRHLDHLVRPELPLCVQCWLRRADQRHDAHLLPVCQSFLLTRRQQNVVPDRVTDASALCIANPSAIVAAHSPANTSSYPADATAHSEAHC